MQGIIEDMCYNINNVSMRKGVCVLHTPPRSSFVVFIIAKQNQKFFIIHLCSPPLDYKSAPTGKQGKSLPAIRAALCHALEAVSEGGPVYYTTPLFSRLGSRMNTGF